MSDAGWWDRVVAEMTDYQRRHPENLPGAVLGAEQGSGGLRLAAVGEGWTPDTVCNIGSMSKTFTATAVLLALEEAGRLDVDASVHTLPGMSAFAADPARRAITVAHLLQHSSGMPVFVQGADAPPAPCRDTGADAWAAQVGPTVPWLGSPGYTNEHVLMDGRCRPARAATLDAVSEYLMRTYPLVHEPGARYTYSSVNYVVAGRLVEQLTGLSPNVFLRRRLFEPLGMADSFFVADPAADPAIAEGVTDAQRARIAAVSLITRDGTWPPEVAPGPGGGWDTLRRGWRYAYPDGGMYSTAADLLTYLRMVRDGGLVGGRRVVSAAVHALLVGDHGLGHTMAFGLRRTATPYGQGPGTLEHLGNLMTYFWYDPRPAEPVIAVLLSQRLANALVDNNMADGMRAIFRVFVPLVCGSNAAHPAVPA